MTTDLLWHWTQLQEAIEKYTEGSKESLQAALESIIRETHLYGKEMKNDDGTYKSRGRDFTVEEMQCMQFLVHTMTVFDAMDLESAWENAL